MGKIHRIGNDSGEGLFTDSSGNVYVTNNYQDNVDIDGDATDDLTISGSQVEGGNYDLEALPPATETVARCELKSFLTYREAIDISRL